MTQLMAFIKKEWMELLRTGKFIIIVILFMIFGVMNPAIAKLTPWLMKMYSKSLEESGLILTEAKVDALTSWVQFYKNVPMALIVFLLMFSGILAVEYQKGTLINMITKGLSRWKIVISKSVVLLLLWSFGYWMCYGITYAYNEYFWDNSIAKEVGFAAFCVYLLGGMADRSYDAYVCTFFSRFSDGGWNWQCILCALSVKYAAGCKGISSNLSDGGIRFAVRCWRSGGL